MNSRNGPSRVAGAGRAALVVSALALSAGAVCLGGSAEAVTVQGRSSAHKYGQGGRSGPRIGNGKRNKISVYWNSPTALRGPQNASIVNVSGFTRTMSSVCTRQHRVCKIRMRVR